MSGFSIGTARIVGAQEKIPPKTFSPYLQKFETAPLKGGGYVIVWTAPSDNPSGDGSGASVLAQIYDDRGAAVGTKFVVNQTLSGDQILTSVAGLADGGFVVGWTNKDPGFVSAQRFSATGSKIGAEVTVTPVEAGHSVQNAYVKPTDQGFVLSWNDTRNSTASDGRVTSVSSFMSQRYSLSGQAEGAPIVYNNPSTTPDFTVLRDGGFVIVEHFWQTHWSRNGFQFRLADRVIITTYDAAGTQVASQAYTANDSFDLPSVAPTSDGGYIVIWDAGFYGSFIRAAAFSATGVPESSYDISTTFVIPYSYSELIALGQDRFLVTWQSPLDVRAQIIDATGKPVGGEFTLPGQKVTALSDGNFVVSWTQPDGTILSTLYTAIPEAPQAGVATGTGGADLIVGDATSLDLRGMAGDDFLYAAREGGRLDGGDGNDSLYAGIGSDIINGGNGDDKIYVSKGTSFIDGGNGDNDVVFVSTVLLSQPVVIDLRLTGPQSLVGGGTFTLANIEGLMAIGGATLIGNDGANYLEGTVLIGNGGADQLVGQTASYETSSQGLNVFLGAAEKNTGDAAGDVFVGVRDLLGSNFDDTLGGSEIDNTLNGRSGNDIIFGYGGDDSLQGDVGNDWLIGGEGIDSLVGGRGNDVLMGGAGTDTLDGGEDFDVASYREAAGGVTVDMVNLAVNAGEAAGDTLVNVENLWGSKFNDTLYGDDNGGQVYGFEGNDILWGRGGDDYFYGGEGQDTLNGGAGIDNFFFLQFRDNVNVWGTPEPAEGGDTITDFGSTWDRIIVSRYWFGFGNIQGEARGLTSQYADFITNGTLNATSTKPTFFWNATNGQLYFDGDGTGSDLSPVLLVTLTNGASLQLSDIWTA